MRPFLIFNTSQRHDWLLLEIFIIIFHDSEDWILFNRSKIRKGRNVYKNVEDATATVSYIFSVSSPKVLTLIFCNKIEKHYLKNTYTSIILRFPEYLSEKCYMRSIIWETTELWAICWLRNNCWNYWCQLFQFTFGTRVKKVSHAW